MTTDYELDEIAAQIANIIYSAGARFEVTEVNTGEIGTILLRKIISKVENLYKIT